MFQEAEYTYKSTVWDDAEGRRLLIEMCIIKGLFFSNEKIEIIEIDNAKEC